MAATESTYFGLTKIREQGPESKDWAAVDRNPEIISLILKMFESHSHNGVAAITYPGYDAVPANIDYPTLSVSSTGGVLSPGSTISVRLSYLNAYGLETDGSPETITTLPPAASRPLSPRLSTITGATTGQTYLAGGTYIYVITKTKGSGETTMSDVLTVNVPYDKTYSVTLLFDAINTYTDGTTGINIYRSAGLNSQFQLLTTITNASATTYVDQNSVPSANAGIQPPTNNTFDANRKITIDWSTITPPTGAVKMRVYVSQQAGIWSTNHLLTEVAITSGVLASNFVDYLGSESLATGWPSNSTEIPAQPPKINLSTDTTGGFSLSGDAHFNGYKAIEMVLGTTSVSTNGAIWYDSANHVVKAFINGASQTLTSQVARRNEVKNPKVANDATDWTYVQSGVTWSTAPARQTSSPPYQGSYNYGASNVTAFTTSGSLYLRYQQNNGTPQGIAVTAGESFYASMGAIVGVASTFKARISIYFYTEAGAFVSEVTGPLSSTLPSGSWVEVTGSGTVPATATRAYVQVLFTNASGSNWSGSSYMVCCGALYVRGTTGPVTYFDGDSVGAFWEGTANSSTSLSGAFRHAVEEAGGHKAANITLGTSNVETVLSRIANVNSGARSQAQNFSIATASTSNPTIASTTPAQITDMITSLTPQLSGQPIELTFDGQFSLATAGTTLNILIYRTGSAMSATLRSFKSSVDGETFPISLKWTTLATGTSSENWAIYWYTDGGSATSIGVQRQLVARVVM